MSISTLESRIAHLNKRCEEAGISYVTHITTASTRQSLSASDLLHIHKDLGYIEAIPPNTPKPSKAASEIIMRRAIGVNMKETLLTLTEEYKNTHGTLRPLAKVLYPEDELQQAYLNGEMHTPAKVLYPQDSAKETAYIEKIIRIFGQYRPRNSYTFLGTIVSSK